MTAIWEPAGDPVTVGYRLYYGPSSGNYVIEIDVGNVTSRRLDLIPGIPYFFVVRAYNAAGVVGPPSNEFAVVGKSNPQTSFSNQLRSNTRRG